MHLRLDLLQDLPSLRSGRREPPADPSQFRLQRRSNVELGAELTAVPGWRNTKASHVRQTQEELNPVSVSPK